MMEATTKAGIDPPHPRTVVHAGAASEFVAAGFVAVPGTRQWQAVMIHVRNGKVSQTVPLGEPEDLPWSKARAQEALEEAASAAVQVAYPPAPSVMLAPMLALVTEQTR